MPAPIPTRIVPGARPSARTPQQIEHEFRARLAAGARLVALGDARRSPARLLARGYVPKYRVDLFDVVYYLTDVRQNADIRFFVAYLALEPASKPAKRIHPRIFYKDISLVWRSASHFVRTEDENWIGKGDVELAFVDGEEVVTSNEATTDLPLEIQAALEDLSRRAQQIPHDEVAVRLILRRGPSDRIEPYRDFTEPRRRARADRRNLVNGGRSIARFTRDGDPASLRFARGFEPDFRAGVVESGRGVSKLYGGTLRRFRVVSCNRKVQYLFFAGRRQVWIGACQATTTELTSYGVRSIDAVVDERLLIPGLEYHFLDTTEDPPVFVSQIPAGFAGATSALDPARADASPWLDQLPVIREFRRAVLGARRRSSS